MSTTTGSAVRAAGGDVLRRALPPVLLGVVGLAAWQALVVAADVPPFLLPSPTAIVEQLVEVGPLVLEASLATGANVLVGTLLGAVVAVLAALLAAGLPADRLQLATARAAGRRATLTLAFEGVPKVQP